MYVGVDIGGTKTLLAVLDEHGVIKEQKKFPTPKNYDNFILELKHTLTQLDHQDFRAGSVAIPGNVDRKHGRGIKLGNLGWKNFNIQHDAEKVFNCPIAIENDAKLAGLSEAMLLKDKYDKVAYFTFSTGIGYSLINNREIDTSLGDGGGKHMLLPYKGKLVGWETLVSGRAIVERFGKMAKDINDQETWHKIVRDMAAGMVQVFAVMEPEVAVIGGSVGTYFDRYGDLLRKELKKYELPLLKMPHVQAAQRAETAVVYGCYDYAKQVYGHAAAHK
jgi:predicted NBD/HSP70 family sugar kinase